MAEKQFRFQELEIWKRAAELSMILFQASDELDELKLYRFAEQLRAATLSTAPCFRLPAPPLPPSHLPAFYL